MDRNSQVSVIITKSAHTIESSINNEDLTINRIVFKCITCSKIGHLNRFSDLCQFNESTDSAYRINCKSTGHLNIKSNVCPLIPKSPFFIGPKETIKCNYCNLYGHKMIRSFVNCFKNRLKNRLNPNYQPDNLNDVTVPVITEPSQIQIIQSSEFSGITDANNSENIISKRILYWVLRLLLYPELRIIRTL